MPLEFNGSNVVVAARQYNPSILSQIWLVDNGIVPRDGFREGCIFTDMLVQVQSDQFVFNVVPNQLQFAPTERDNEQDVIVEKVGRIIRTLPHTPFSAVGLNFNWLAIADDEAVRDLSRQIFFRPETTIHRAFDLPDSRFGGYLSKDSLGARLKLDVKPGFGANAADGERRDFLQFQFNYHLDVTGDNRVNQIEQLLGRWDEAREQASDIAHQSIEGYDFE